MTFPQFCRLIHDIGAEAGWRHINRNAIEMPVLLDMPAMPTRIEFKLSPGFSISGTMFEDMVEDDG